MIAVSPTLFQVLGMQWWHGHLPRFPGPGSFLISRGFPMLRNTLRKLEAGNLLFLPRHWSKIHPRDLEFANQKHSVKTVVLKETTTETKVVTFLNVLPVKSEPITRVGLPGVACDPHVNCGICFGWQEWWGFWKIPTVSLHQWSWRICLQAW